MKAATDIYRRHTPSTHSPKFGIVGTSDCLMYVIVCLVDARGIINIIIIVSFNECMPRIGAAALLAWLGLGRHLCARACLINPLVSESHLHMDCSVRRSDSTALA